MELLEGLVEAGVQVQDWLYDLAMHVLIEAGEVDEVVQVAELRTKRQQREVPGSIWFRLLDAASDSFNHAATAYVWKRRVQPEYLIPSSGQCLNCLRTAARSGDVELATDVFQALAKRNSAFEVEHYELLLDTYVKATDVYNALKLLCVMAELRMQPDQASTRKLFRHLASQSERSEDSFSMLQELRGSHAIPPVALNAIIEARAVYNLDQAMEYYKEFRNLCGVGPNLETFNMLLRQCVQMKDKASAMFLASEMVALEVEPNALTYDRLVLVCTWTGEIDDAFGYLFETQQQGLKVRLGTLFSLGRHAATAADPRAIKVVEAIKMLGEDGERPAALIQRIYSKAQEGRLEEAQEELRARARHYMSPY